MHALYLTDDRGYDDCAYCFVIMHSSCVFYHQTVYHFILQFTTACMWDFCNQKLFFQENCCVGSVAELNIDDLNLSTDVGYQDCAYCFVIISWGLSYGIKYIGYFFNIYTVKEQAAADSLALLSSLEATPLVYPWTGILALNQYRVFFLCIYSLLVVLSIIQGLVLFSSEQGNWFSIYSDDF